MNKGLIGAVSLSALMAVGLAACGNDSKIESDYAEADTAAVENEDADAMTDSSAYAQNDETAATDDEYASYNDEVDAASSSSMQTAQTDEMDSSATATSGSMTLASLTDVRSRDEVANVVDQIFTTADSNDDGVLDRSEYLALAMDLNASGSSAGMNADATAGTDASLNPEADVPNTGGVDNTTVAEGDTSYSTTSDQGAETVFAEASGDDESMTAAEMREEFLARFDEADENDDEQLDTLERMTFARLAAGEKTQK